MSSWIKVRSHLSTHPHVVRIASALCLPCVHVLGALVHVWSVADLHADGEKLSGMTPESLDKLTETPGLAQQMVACGWLKVLDDGLQLVNYQAHNGANAKRRALDSERKKTVRIASASCPHDVRKTAQNVRPKSKSKNKSKTTSTFHSDVVSAESDVPTDSPPPVAVFPCQGIPSDWSLDAGQVADWKATYPGLDIEAEVRKALAWIRASGTRRKTASGMPRFLVNWLNRAADSPRQSRPAPYTRPAPEPPKPWSQVYAESQANQAAQVPVTVAAIGTPQPSQILPGLPALPSPGGAA